MWHGQIQLSFVSLGQRVGFRADQIPAMRHEE